MKIGLAILALILFAAIAGPALSPYEPFHMSLERQYERPSWEHPFGLDQNGSDILSRVMYGARISLKVAAFVVMITVLTGLILGSVAGYRGGLSDSLIMRLIDMLHAFPGFLLALALVAMLGPSITNMIIAMSLTGWTGYARLVRAEVLHLKTKEFVSGARSLGAGPFRILTIHILPNLLGALLVQATFGAAGAVLTESSLSFLGLGAPPNEPTWGSLLNAGRRVLVDAPHISFFAGLSIFSLVLALNLIGDSLRDFLDPKKS